MHVVGICPQINFCHFFFLQFELHFWDMSVQNKSEIVRAKALICTFVFTNAKHQVFEFSDSPGTFNKNENPSFSLEQTI